MKLNRLKLIELVQGAINACEGAQQTWDENVAAAEKAWEKTWRDSQVGQWRPFRDKLTKALKDGSHVTRADLPLVLPRYSGDPIEGPLYRPFNRGRYKTSYGKQSNDWYADHGFGPRPVTQKNDFETILVFLEMVDEEVITTGQLQQSGFRNLEKLVSAATSGAGWKQDVPKVRDLS